VGIQVIGLHPTGQGNVYMVLMITL
jgi:hypothetical protein